MTKLAWAAASFDVIVALGSIIHVPRDQHPALFQAIYDWLRPGGVALLMLGSHDMPMGYEADWLGVLMYWSSYDAATYQRLIADSGFTIISAQTETQIEDGDEVTFLWVLAEKPAEA
jgi:cyclopropane fatty-acyl-phospholipid synthase-like methyltransferase